MKKTTIKGKVELTVNNLGVAVETFCIVNFLLFQGIRVPELSVVLYAVVDSPVTTLDTSGGHFGATTIRIKWGEREKR